LSFHILLLEYIEHASLADVFVAEPVASIAAAVHVLVEVSFDIIYRDLLHENARSVQNVGNDSLHRFNTGKTLSDGISVYHLVEENKWMNSILVKNNYDLQSAANTNNVHADAIKAKVGRGTGRPKDRLLVLNRDEVNKHCLSCMNQ